MSTTALIVGGILVLSVVSGMLGLGVAFAAVPFLSLFMSDLVHEVQPLSLLLNGVTAAFAAFGAGWAHGGPCSTSRPSSTPTTTNGRTPIQRRPGRPT